VIAPERGLRPGAGRGRIPDATTEELEACPFCAGREDRTPPETLRLGDPWRVRVVPNLYPAFEHQEVVIHSREHKRSFAELDDDEVILVADAWARRREARPNGYLHACVNEGPDAGASLAHSHSQLVWLPEAPPVVAAEAAAAVRDAGRYEVEAADGLVAFCPAAAHVPYEVRIAAERSSGEIFRTEALGPALSLLRSTIRRLRAVEGSAPWNAWLHVTESDWHIELVPRLTVFAALELGAGIYVNPLPPEDAARRLREARP
jgi:UDPglucose--hexose-1-phosphate uridylyltransferase